MRFPKIEVGYNIVFNNTGFEWTDIQMAGFEDLTYDLREEYGLLED